MCNLSLRSLPIGDIVPECRDVNDRYGHQAGDVVLREVAACIRDNLRPTDLSARYGGEEFVALLPRTSLNTLIQITKRLNVAVGEHPITYNGINIFVTISIGGVVLTTESRSLDELLTQADQAMYQAKAAGRDRTVIFNRAVPEDFLENKKRRLARVSARATTASEEIAEC